MSPLLEPNYYGLWAGKQTAKGAPNAAPAHRLIQVAGDFAMPRDDGEENWSDLTKYGNRTDWVNSLLGNGEPGCEATPDELAFLLWLFHGAETVVAVTGPPAVQKHTFVPSAGRGHWATFMARVGQSVIRRHQFNDCLVTRVQIEGSTANKAVRVTPRVLSLDPGQIFAADPAQALPADKAFLYTDGQGTFTIDGVVFPGQSQFTLVIDDAWEPVYGDDIVPFDLVQGQPVVTIGVTVLFDANALAQFNKLAYGTAAPAAGTKPLKRIPALGAYAFDLLQKDQAGAVTGREFKLTIPGVKWTLPDAPGPNPDGGSTEIALAGAMRPISGQSPYTLDVFTANGTVAFIS
jgi:hypothetical protein